MGRTICLVGYGNVARLYESVLKALGTKILVVDPHLQNGRKIYASLTCLAADQTLNAIDVFIVCTPTEEHLRSLKAILQLNPRARIIVEKPVVESDQLEDLSTLQHQFADARILEASQYARTQIIPRFAEHVRKSTKGAFRVKDVYAEFTKNRVWDNLAGRFRDSTFGPLSYEGPHLLALVDNALRSIGKPDFFLGLPKIECYQRDLTADRIDEGSVGFNLAGDNFPMVSIYTSTLGVLGSPLRTQTTPPSIPMGSEERYRLITLTMESGEQFTLKMEPQLGFDGKLVRNLYEVFQTSGKTCAKVGAFEANVFSEGVCANMVTLMAPEDKTKSLLHLAKKRLETLSKMVKCLKRAGGSLAWLEQHTGNVR